MPPPPPIILNTDHVEDILKDDQKGRDQRFVDELLSNEMLQLSVKDRNDIQEEIHGVKCLAVEETPELISNSLRELSDEIDRNIPDSQKRAYLESLKPIHTRQHHRHKHKQKHIQKQAKSNTSNCNNNSNSCSHSEDDDVPQPDTETTGSHPPLSSSLSPSSDSTNNMNSNIKNSNDNIDNDNSNDNSNDNIDNNNNDNSKQHTHLSYIHGEDFKLRFLRCDLFDVKKAAKRLVLYLDLLVEIFGAYALKRPICLTDFSREELRHMRKGLMQLMPYRDRSGRRIIVVFPEEEVSQIPPDVKAKIAMYQLWAVGCNDTVTQRKGIIVLIWFDASFRDIWKIKYKLYTLNADRFSAIHCCSPDTPRHRLRRALAVMRAGSENISKLNFHLGESMELHYKLQGYGIPFEHVPISWTGTVKVQYLKQWMRIRQAIEQYLMKGIGKSSNCSCSDGSCTCSDGSSDECTVSTSTSSSSSSFPNIIECPQLQDVVFRQGTSGVSHPGNVTFRSQIESTVIKQQIQLCEQQQEQQQHQQLHKQQKHHKEQQQKQQQSSGVGETKPSNQKKPKAKRPKQLALDIYEERLQRTGNTTGRFLIWNNSKGWWNELTDKEQICMKIEYMVREIKKATQSPSSSLSNCKPSKIGHSGGAPSSSIGGSPYSSSNHHRNNSLYHPSNNNSNSNTIHLQSGTSLFQSQDGRTPPIFAANKRQRLEQLGSNYEEGSGYVNDNSNNCHKGCFGIRCTPLLP